MPDYNFYTYILTNLTKNILCTGVTNDLKRRLYEHYTGNHSKKASRINTSAIIWYGTKDINIFIMQLKEKRK